LLDQGLPRSAARELLLLGNDAVHVSELGMGDATNEEIIQKASETHRIVVTLDADFHTLMVRSNATKPSVIRIRVERLKAPALIALLNGIKLSSADALN